MRGEVAADDKEVNIRSMVARGEDWQGSGNGHGRYPVRVEPLLYSSGGFVKVAADDERAGLLVDESPEAEQVLLGRAAGAKGAADRRIGGNESDIADRSMPDDCGNRSFLKHWARQRREGMCCLAAMATPLVRRRASRSWLCAAGCAWSRYLGCRLRLKAAICPGAALCSWIRTKSCSTVSSRPDTFCHDVTLAVRRVSARLLRRLRAGLCPRRAPAGVETAEPGGSPESGAPLPEARLAGTPGRG